MADDRGAQFWSEIRGHRSPAPPVSYEARVPDSDADDLTTTDEPSTPTWEAQSITGRTFLLAYIDSKKQESERLVLCRRLNSKAGTLYLDAFCYVRERPRSFRADRIRSLVDHETGEVHSPGSSYLELYLPNSVSAAPFRYGLPPTQFADFNAALNVLAFMARCDGKWHPLEADAIIDFASKYWLRAEVGCPFDEAEIIRHASRLAPDAEAFWVSLHRCATEPIIRTILRRHVAAVIDADGFHHPLEAYWGGQIDEFLST